MSWCRRVAFLAIRQWWVLVPLAFGFLARVAAGPRFSPLGRIVTQRRHAAAASSASVRARAAQAVRPGHRADVQRPARSSPSWPVATPLAVVLIAGLLVAASLEAFAGLCLGCVVFQRLMRWGVIPASVCRGVRRHPFPASPAERTLAVSVGAALGGQGSNDGAARRPNGA